MRATHSRSDRSSRNRNSGNRMQQSRGCPPAAASSRLNSSGVRQLRPFFSRFGVSTPSTGNDSTVPPIFRKRKNSRIAPSVRARETPDRPSRAKCARNSFRSSVVTSAGSARAGYRSRANSPTASRPSGKRGWSAGWIAPLLRSQEALDRCVNGCGIGLGHSHESFRRGSTVPRPLQCQNEGAAKRGPDNAYATPLSWPRP